METNVQIRPHHHICINAEKVYDWIIEEGSGSTSVPAGSMPTALPVGATNVTATCYLSDASGAPMPLNTAVSVTENTPRTDKQFEVNGCTITLQEVNFTKTLYAVLQVECVEPVAGNRVLLTSNPLPFTFLESVILCAPPGTYLVVRISGSSCTTMIRRNTEGNITGFAVSISVCQSIQTVAPVTIEVPASMCQPREPLHDKCGNPIMPPTCPVVFPRF